MTEQNLSKILNEHLLTRRQVLKLMTGTGMMLAAGPLLGKSASPSIRRRPIPSSGEHIPIVGLGTYQTFDVGNNPEAREPVKEVLRRFVELGGSVVDSSPMYGNAETVLGDLATELGVHDELFLATKVWTRGREEGIRQMERSLQRLRSDRIDLMQVHNLVDWRTHLKTLRQWKDQGHIRYLGITHYTAHAYDDLEQIMRNHELDFVQLNYSIASREAERRLLPLAKERGIAILVNRPYQQGALFRRVRGKELPAWATEFDCASWGQFFLKYILSHPAATCVIPATSNPRHLRDNMQAGYGRLPDAEERQRMVTYFKEL